METLFKSNRLLIGTALVVFLLSTGTVLLTATISKTQTTSVSHAATILEPYCRNGVYYAKSQVDGTEISCGNAPLCGGTTYADIEAKNKDNNLWESIGKCWVHKTLGVDKCATTCKGYVPLCCYDMELTKNPESCYWVERKYCHPSQCAGVPGGNCGDAIVTYCKDVDKCITDASQIPYIPLTQRVMSAPSTGTTTTPQNPTNTPAPTNNSTAFPLKFNNNPQRDNTDVSVGIEIVDINNQSEVSEILHYFQGFPLFIKLKRPQPAVIQSATFTQMKDAGFTFYVSQGDYGSLNNFAAAYYQKYTNSDSALILELDNSGVIDPAQTQALVSTYPTLRFVAANFGAGDYKGIQTLIDKIPYKTLHAVSYQYSPGSSADIYGTDFFTANATFFDTADKSFMVKWPNDSFPNENLMTALTGISIANGNTDQNEARRFGIIAIAFYNYAQENGQHGLKYINMGSFGSMRPHAKSMAQFIAELAKRKMRVFWPNTSTGNGDPWQNNGVLDPSTKPVVGIAADSATDGVAYFLVNGSAQPQSITLVYPPGISNGSLTKVSTLQGVQPDITLTNDRVDLAPYESIGLLKGSITQGGATPTPTATTAPLPVGITAITLDVPILTPPPGVANCAALSETSVDNFRPQNATLAGTKQITWKAVPGAASYAVRINDLANGWKNDCAAPQNPGDICIDNITSPTHNFTFVEGHTYHIWVHAINTCGTWNKGGHVVITTPPDTTPNTCRIQGYRMKAGYIDNKTLPFIYGTNLNKVNQQASFSIWSTPDIVAKKVSVAGTTPLKEYNTNPYHIIVPANQTYTVSIEPESNYTIGSTSCTNRTDCHTFQSNSSFQEGTSRTITCPANGHVDVVWYFYQNSQQVVAPQACSPLLSNGLQTEKHDIVIIPDGYTDPAAFKTDADNVVNNMKKANLGALFNKLNFWIATDLSKSYGITPACALSGSKCGWDREKSIDTMRQCEGDSLLMIGNIPYDKNLTNLGFSILGGKTSLVYRFSTDAAAHELSHAIASANDEYNFHKTHEKGYPLEYNCANSQNGDPASCTKWQSDGLATTQCLPICGFTDWYRSSDKSIMSAYEDMLSQFTFNPPTLKMWEVALQNFK